MGVRVKQFDRVGSATVAVCLLSLAACQTTTTRCGAPPQETAALRATIDELYAAFCFDPGMEPNWEAQRRIALDGASFVPSVQPERSPKGVDTETFLEDFKSFATSEQFAATGFHERILGVRVDVFGGVAHAYVSFEGFVPGDGEVLTRGLDSLQFVKDGEAWKLASFSTQFEGGGLQMPERFLVGSYDG